MAVYSEEMLIAVSHLYYSEGLKQQDIAFRLNLSRLAVGRMLKKARDVGLVQITVKRPLPEVLDLVFQLEQKYGLRAVRVVQTGATMDDTTAEMGRAGADFLSTFLRPGCRIGAAWSRTVSSIIPYIRRTSVPDVRVNELAGTYLAPNIPYSVSWPLAERLKVPLESVPLPLIVKTENLRQLMFREPMIRKAMANAARVDIALVGLGNIKKGSSLAHTGYMSSSQIKEVVSKGAVGDILMHWYERSGHCIHTSFEKRTIAISWEQVRRLSFIVAMAFGREKVDAIKGALAGKLINGLITDKDTAKSLLK